MFYIPVGKGLDDLKQTRGRAHEVQIYRDIKNQLTVLLRYESTLANALVLFFSNFLSCREITVTTY